MTSVEASEAADMLERLVERAAAGEEVFLTRHGHPAAQLIAIEQPPEVETLPPRQFGRMRDKIWNADELNAPMAIVPDEDR
jgi:prevent-host-death family protein